MRPKQISSFASGLEPLEQQLSSPEGDSAESWLLHADRSLFCIAFATLPMQTEAVWVIVLRQGTGLKEAGGQKFTKSREPYLEIIFLKPQKQLHDVLHTDEPAESLSSGGLP